MANFVIERSFLRMRDNIGLSNQDEFNSITYLGEVCIKILSILQITMISQINPVRSKYIIRDVLTRGSSAGSWVSCKDQLCNYMSRSSSNTAKTVSRWCNERNTIDYFDPRSSEFLEFVKELSGESISYRRARIDLEKFIVYIRNKTAHGAKTDEFYEKHMSFYRNIVENYAKELIKMIDENDINMFQVSLRNRRYRIRRLRSVVNSEEDLDTPLGDGIYINLDGNPIKTVPLFYYDQTRGMFFLPNNEIDQKGYLETLDYFNGETKKIFIDQNIMEQKVNRNSHTSGMGYLEVGEGAFHNLPKLEIDYIRRLDLENKITQVLVDRKRRMITLHGRGGAGKTTLALEVVKQFVEGKLKSDFDIVLWLSARNVDLLEEGPREVKRDVSDLESMANFIERFNYFNINKEDHYLQKLISIFSNPASKILLILDNFETVDNMKLVHDTFEEIVEFPNKVLITGRKKQSEKEFVIPVLGMEEQEAKELIAREAERRYIAGKINDKIVSRIYEQSGGVPYIIKLMVSAYANGVNKDFIVEKVLSDDQIREKLFRPSYEMLSELSKYVFLISSVFSNDVPFPVLAGLIYINYGELEFGENVFYNSIESIKSLALSYESISDEISYLSLPVDAKRFGKEECEGSHHKPDVYLNKHMFNQNLSSLMKISSIDEMEDIVSKIYSNEKDVSNLKWCDKFFVGVAAVYTEVYRYIAMGRLLREDIFSYEDISKVVTISINNDLSNAELRYLYAQYLFSKGDYGQAIIYFIEASDISKNVEKYTSAAAKAINDYFRNKRDNMHENYYKSVFVDIIIERLTNLMENDNINLDGSYGQLYWLLIRKGREEVALGVVDRGIEKFPRSHLLKDLRNRHGY